MCEIQRVVGAAICSKCGYGLFLVAQPVNLEEEERNFHRSRRDQVMSVFLFFFNRTAVTEKV